MTWILPRQLHTSACALDTEALSLDLNEQSQVCAQSLFVRSKPSPLAIWLRKWKRDSWTRHLSGRILRPSLGQRFATEWTSSLGAIPVSPSVQQGKDLEGKTPGISGRISQEAFQFFNQESASLKTSRATLPAGCITFCATWEDWVTEQRGAYSARLNAVHRTRESGSSSWPTSSARDWKGCYTTLQRKDDKMRGDLLPDAVNLEEKHGRPAPGNWPTPNCMDVITPNRDLTQMESKGHWGKNMNTGKLSEMVNYGPPAPVSSSTDGSRQESWPTPNSQPAQRKLINGKNQSTKTGQIYGTSIAQAVQQWQTATVSTGAHKQKDGSMIDKLDQQVKSWATPDVSDRRSNNCRQIGLSNQTQGKLNPRWVETLMGLPVGWTMPSCVSPVTIERMNSDCSVTVLSQQQQNEPSGL